MHQFPGGLVKPDKYQVFLMDSPAGLPLSFGMHPWFVVNKKGALSRWEVLWRPEDEQAGKKWGHLVMDVTTPFRGLRVLHFFWRLSWRAKVLNVLEGDERSLAAQMAGFIEQSPTAYPYKEVYSFRGPNSNTYVEWVLNQFPEAGLSLPWNAFGKKRI